MLKIVQRDFADHQLIIASIHDFKLQDEKLIELDYRLFGYSDIIQITKDDDAGEEDYD